MTTEFNEILNKIRMDIFGFRSHELDMQQNIDQATEDRETPVIHIGHLQINVTDHIKGGV